MYNIYLFVNMSERNCVLCVGIGFRPVLVALMV